MIQRRGNVSKLAGKESPIQRRGNGRKRERKKKAFHSLKTTQEVKNVNKGFQVRDSQCMMVCKPGFKARWTRALHPNC
jgi:hypothetical protein